MFTLIWQLITSLILTIILGFGIFSILKFFLGI